MNKRLILLCAILVSCTHLFSVELDKYVDHMKMLYMYYDYKINEVRLSVDDLPPLLLDETKTEITADDGTKFILKQWNPEYKFDALYGLGVEEMKEYESKYIIFVVLCEHEIHVVSRIYYDKQYFDGVSAQDFIVEKQKECENVTLYNFIYNKKNYTKDGRWYVGKEEEYVWIDKKEETYCGAFRYEYGSYSNDKEAYQKSRAILEDMYIDVVNTEMLKSENKLNNYYDYDSYYYTQQALVEIIDEDIVAELEKKLDDLYERKYEMFDQMDNQRLLMHYSLSIIAVKCLINIGELYCDLEVDDITSKLPDGLPTNNEELIRYLYGMSRYFYDFAEGGYEQLPLLDYYGIPIKFEITADGLKATSAGRDKAFDTEDDQSHLSRYDKVYYIYDNNE